MILCRKVLRSKDSSPEHASLGRFFAGEFFVRKKIPCGGKFFAGAFFAG
jgi:hypothetical protein